MFNRHILKAFVFSLTLSQSFAHIYDVPESLAGLNLSPRGHQLHEYAEIFENADLLKSKKSNEDSIAVVAAEKPKNDDFHVLCLDGGGTRAVGTLVYLAELEMRTGRQVHELFDHIYGTSTGGLAACLLAQGYRATEVLDIYLDNMSDVFARSGWDQLTNPMGLTGPMYSHANLENLVSAYMNDLTLGDLKTPVSLIATHAQTQETVLLSSAQDQTKHISVLQAVRATSAAPTYFAAQDIDGMTYVDGGIAANNPVLKAYEDITLNKRNNKRHINIFSVGTGLQNPMMLDKFAGKLGFGHPANISSYFMSCSEANIHKTMQSVAALTPYLTYTRMNFKLPYSVDLADTNPQTQKLLMQTAFDHATQSDAFKSYVKLRTVNA